MIYLFGRKQPTATDFSFEMVAWKINSYVNIECNIRFKARCEIDKMHITMTKQMETDNLVAAFTSSLLVWYIQSC
jgi:hypothetical protein